MTRIKISACILLTLICISIFSGIWVNKQCDLLLECIFEIQHLCGENKTDSANEYCVILEKNWNNFRKKACILIRSEKLDDAEEICSELPCLADSAEIFVSAEKLKHIIRNIEESESPHIVNIL